MRSTLRTLALLLALTAAVSGPSIIVPSAALASTTVVVQTSAASLASDPPLRACKPAHEEGRDWDWHDAQGHWDHREWDHGDREWKHIWSENHFCDGQADGDDNGGDRKQSKDS